MASWVIMEKPGDRSGAQTVFVRDRFSFVAFVVPLLWLLWHRLWIESLLLLAVAIGIAVAGAYGGLATAEPAVSLLVSLFIALEGPNLRIRALSRRGWREAGVVEADNRDEAEYRWFSGTNVAPGAESAPARQPVLSAKPVAAAAPAIGMVEFPGGR